jgi:cathepsin L
VTLALGCNGGDAETAYFYVILRQAGRFNSEKGYPYTAFNGKCKYTAADALTTVVDYAFVSKSESSLQNVVATYGVVTVGIDASKKSFDLYKSGIYNEPSCSTSNLDHQVAVVGYGTEGSDFWIVKNSWGVNWGEKGYIRMSRNKNNQCGITSDAVIPFATK